MPPTSTHATVSVAGDLPAKADAVVALVHKTTKPADVRLPPALRAALARLIDAKLVTGKSNEVTVHLLDGAAPARRLVVVGLGSTESFSAECMREAGVAVARVCRKHRLVAPAVLLPATPGELPAVPGGPPAGPGEAAAAQALAEGLLIGSFRYDEYKGAVARTKEQDQPAPGPAAVTIVPVTGPSDRPGWARVTTAVARGRAVGEGQNFARTIASRPGNDLTPVTLVTVARQLARAVKLTVRVIDDREMRRLKMGGILAVGGGSATPPRVVVLEHRGTGAGRTGGRKPLLVVGKTITFDTGGVSIKPAERMGLMIYDKCGGMAVLGFMYAVAKLKLPVPVVGILAAAENHLGGRAYRPGDILRMYNGVTVDVTNTDAEGRLVLGDALAWGVEQYRPTAVLDLATLTGGVVVALGRTMAGVMGTDDGLIDELSRAAKLAGESIWRLPLGDAQREQIKGTHADLVNSAGRDAHPLQGGAFLSHFVPAGLPWAHLDIAGVADTDKETPLYTKGATGWGVRTLIRWAEARAATR